MAYDMMARHDGEMHAVSIDAAGEYTLVNGSRVPIYLPTGMAPTPGSFPDHVGSSASVRRQLVFGAATATSFLLSGTDHQRQFVRSRAAEIGLDPNRLEQILGRLQEGDGSVIPP